MEYLIVILVIIIVFIVIITIITYYKDNKDNKNRGFSLNFTNLSKTPATLNIKDSSTGKILYNETIYSNDTLTLPNNESRIDILFVSRTCFDYGIDLKSIKYIGRHNYVISDCYTVSSLLADETCLNEGNQPRIQKIVINNNNDSTATINIGGLLSSTSTQILEPTTYTIASNTTVTIDSSQFPNELCKLSNVNRACGFFPEPAYTLTINNNTSNVQGFNINNEDVVINVQNNATITGTGFTLCN